MAFATLADSWSPTIWKDVPNAGGFNHRTNGLAANQTQFQDWRVAGAPGRRQTRRSPRAESCCSGSKPEEVEPSHCRRPCGWRRGFSSPSQSDADAALTISSNHKGAETEPTPAFHNLGGTVDEERLLDEAVVAVLARFRSPATSAGPRSRLSREPRSGRPENPGAGFPAEAGVAASACGASTLVSSATFVFSQRFKI